MNNLEIGLLICRLISSNDIGQLKIEIERLDAESWSLIINFANAYNLIPLLYLKLHHKKLLFKSLPPNILYYFQDAYNAASCDALKSHLEIKRILKLFNDSGIEVILLKGAYIAEAYYENFAERQMCDIDILIKSEDIQKTVSILISDGCTIQTMGDNRATISQDFMNNLDSLNKFTKHLPEIKTPKGFSLEVHWALSYSDESTKSVIDMEKIWNSKESVQIYGTDSYRIKTELLLLYLCVNITEDFFKQKILQLYDIFLIISNEEINWNFLIAKAKEWGCQKDLHGVLIAETKLFNLKVADYVYKDLDMLTACTGKIRNVIVSSAFADLSIAEQYEDKIGHEFSTKRIKDKAKFFYWTFWSKEKMIYHYGVEKGKFNFLICRIKRTVYLLKKYLINFLQLYIINPGKKNKIKERHITSFNVLENWLKK